MAQNPQFTPGQMATLACLWEVTASKPGNVHRGSDFDALTFADFVASAVAIGPVFDAASGRPVGDTVLRAIEATRQVVATNTNLGIVLLLAPLAAAPCGTPLSTGVVEVLRQIDPEDCRQVYAAIRLAEPGGMGSVAEGDVAAQPPTDLIAAMRLASERDLVARQYTNGFADVLGVAVPRLVVGLDRGWSLAEAIVRLHLELMRDYPDSLIARKCGQDFARETAAAAGSVLSVGEPGDDVYHGALADFDFWLRSDHARRNPGTTADMVAATLFAALREGIVTASMPFYR